MTVGNAGQGQEQASPCDSKRRLESTSRSPPRKKFFVKRPKSVDTDLTHRDLYHLDRELSTLRAENRRLSQENERLVAAAAQPQECQTCAALLQLRITPTSRAKDQSKIQKKTTERVFKLAEMCRPSNCFWLEKAPCCKAKECSEQYSHAHVMRLRAGCQVNSQDDQKVWIHNRMTKVRQGNHTRTHAYSLEKPEVISGLDLGTIEAPMTQHLQPVCQKFFCFVTKRSAKFFGENINGVYIDNRVRGRTRVCKQEVACGLWLKHQERFALVMPKTESEEDTIVLPFMTRRHAYDVFVLDQQMELPQIKWQDIPSRSTFGRIWGKDFSRLRTRKWIPFAKCSVCLDLRLLREKTKDIKERQRLDQKLRAHLKLVQRERNAYYNRKKLGIDKGSTYMSMIVDGADQGEYALPYEHIKNKGSETCEKIKMKLMGVLVHGVRAFAYTVVPTCRQGVNVSIEAIHRTLVKLVRSGHKLPPKLYLQLDNTSKQCKSRFLFLYLGLLVHYGTFDKIVVSHLPVGHTHEDIDQMFSRFSVGLRSYSAWNRKEFADVLVNAFTFADQPVVVDHIDEIANISDWGVAANLVKAHHWKGISAFKQFRVFLNSDGEAVMNARVYSGSQREGWQGILDNTLFTHIFALSDRGKRSMLHLPHNFLDFFTPYTIPAAQRQVYEPKELNDIRDGLNKMEERTNRDLSDCRDMLSRMNSPMEFGFHWTREDLTCLFPKYNPQNVASRLAKGQVEQGLEQHEGALHCESKLGYFYLVKPDEVHYQDNPVPTGQERPPYWLGQCKSVEFHTFEGSLYRGCRMQYYEIHDEPWKEHIADNRPRILDYDLVWDEGLVEEIASADMLKKTVMKKRNGKATNEVLRETWHFSPQALKKAKAAVERWADPMECEAWDSDEGEGM